MSWKDRAIPVSGGNKKSSWRDRAVPVKDYKEPTTTRQVQHPDISTQDRLIAKNFAQDQLKQVGFLKSQYPDLEFDISSTGQIRAKSQDSNEWNVLDPDTGIVSMDSLKDLGDVGYDLYSGASEGLATAAGAIGGGVLTAPVGGVGALPGAMVAGAASTAGNEAMRQKLGQYLGIPQEVNMEDVAISGAVGAATPLTFGAGKVRGALPIAGEYMGKGLSKVNPLPWIGEKMSGIPKQVLRNYADDGTRATVDKLEKEGITDYTGAVLDKLQNYVETRKNTAGQELVSAIEGAGNKVNLKDAKATFSKAVKDLGKRESLTKADKQKVNQVKAIKDSYMGLYKKEVPRDFENLSPFEKMKVLRKIEKETPGKFVPDDIGAKRAWDIQKDLKQVAKFEQGMTPADVYAKGASRDAYFKINEALDVASDGLSTKAKDQYKAAIKEEAELLPKFTGKTRADSIQKTYNEMSRLDRQGRKVMQEKLSKLSADDVLNLSDEARALEAFRYLGKGDDGGLLSAVKRNGRAPLAVGGGMLGSLAGYNSGGGYSGAAVGGAGGAGIGALLGSPGAMKAYIRMMRAAGRSSELVTPKNQGLRRGARIGLANEILTEPSEN